MMETHRVLVVVQNPTGFWLPGDLVAYDGPTDWKFEPLDAKAHKHWLSIASPGRVEEYNRSQGISGHFPAGTYAGEMKGEFK